MLKDRSTRTCGTDGFKIALHSYATPWRIGNSFRRKFTASWVWFRVHDLLTHKRGTERERKREREGGRGGSLNFHVELVGASDHADWQYARAVLKLHSHLRIRDAHIPNRCDWIECMKMGILKLVLCSRYLKLFPTRNFNVILDNYWHCCAVTNNLNEIFIQEFYLKINDIYACIIYHFTKRLYYKFSIL